MHSGFTELDERPNQVAFCCSINFSYNEYTEDVGIDDWETKLTGCCSEGDVGSFIDAWCCPWCVIGWQASALMEDGTTGCCNEAMVKSLLADIMCLNVCFLTGIGRCCVPWLGSQQSAYFLRKSVRQHYRLKEPDECCTNDCLIGTLCTACSLAQNTREIERVSGTHPGGCCSRPHEELQKRANEKHKNDMMFYSKDPNVKMMEMMVQKQREAGNDLTKVDNHSNNHNNDYQKHNSNNTTTTMMTNKKATSSGAATTTSAHQPSAEEIYSGVAL